jgi:hypothetical protein
MAIQTWAPGTLYEPGALAQPRTTPAPGTLALQNPGAETGGITGWTITRIGDPTGTTATPTAATDKKYLGSYAFRWQGGSGGGHAGGIEGIWINNARGPVRAGQVVSGSAMIAFDDTSQSQNRAEARIYWFDAGGAVLSFVAGTLIRGNSTSWRMSSVSATAPANAATCSIAVWATANYSGGVRFDDVKWNYSYAADAALVYKAVQAASGYSDNVEPAWPSILGVQVVDNEVIWEAVYANQVTWQAAPILVSGATEPAWPTSVGGYVADGTINWRCTSRRVEDPNCPNTKIVAIAASKVFAGDDDIVRYSATVNPLDWSTKDDAGYLPTGLQNYGANPVAAMGLYRGNLIVFNAEAFQLWQIDEDPASMALLDALPMGSTQHQSVAAVSNDLFFQASQGVRTVGIAASSTNFQAGDVGMPIDPLVQTILATGLVPMALYYPAAGQYWLMFPKKADPLPPEPGEWELLDASGLAYTFTPDPNANNSQMVGSIIGENRFGNLPGGGTGWVLEIAGSGTIGLRLSCLTFTAQDGATVAITIESQSGTETITNASPTPTTAFAPLVIERQVTFGSGGIKVSIVGLQSLKNHTSAFGVEVQLSDTSGGGVDQDGDRTDVFVYSMTRIGQVGAWSRYVFPFAVEDWAVKGDDLYLRSGDSVRRYDDALVGDELASGVIQPFQGMVQWPWLDFGQPAVTKMLYGFDIVGTGEVSVQFGYDQTNGGTFTDPYLVPADTVPGPVIPMPLAAPSLAVRLTYDGSVQWQFNAFNLYLQDQRGMS